MSIVALHGGAAVTMTSLEIASLVESRHDKVKQSIERLAERGVITLPPLGEVSNTGAGPSLIAAYFVSKRDSYIVVAQLSPEFTARLVDRWQELEQQVAKPAPLTTLEILQIAMESEKGRIKAEAEVLALTHVVEAQRPAVEFVDRFVEAKSAKGFREVAKILGVPERKFIADLADRKIIFKQGSNWLPMADHQHAGYFTVKTGEANSHAFVQT